MKNKEKEQAYFDFVEMIKRSWTYARLTESEKEACVSALRFGVEQCLIIGKYEQRWGQLNVVYHAFLLALGYDHGKFREPEHENVPFCVDISA